MYSTTAISQFDLEGLTLQHLRYFNAVAEGETFADAAALIGISQSALSQGIARLEQVTGTRLLERDGRRRRITDAGELVAEEEATRLRRGTGTGAISSAKRPASIAATARRWLSSEKAS